jgi:hypothetical protein
LSATSASTPDAGDDPVPALIDLIGAAHEPKRDRLRQLLAQTRVPDGRTALSLNIARVDDLALRMNGVFSLPDMRWPNSLRYGFVEFRDAIVTPTGFVIAGDRLIFNTQGMPAKWMRGADRGAPRFVENLFRKNFIHKLDIWNETCLISVPADLKTIDEPAFLFDSRHGCGNFAHFAHDMLIQTPSFYDCCAEIGESARTILVGAKFSYEVMSEIFARVLGPHAKAPIFTGSEFHRVRRLFVPTTHLDVSFPSIARGAVVRLVSLLGEALKPYRAGGKRRIFISRSDAGRPASLEPQFDNEDALVRALAALGFERLVLSRLGVSEYLEAFVNSEIIVGVHGAGLGNVVLSASPRLLEIVVPGPYAGWDGFRLFVQTGMGMPFRRLAMAPPADGVAHYDIADIVAAVNELLATPCPAVAPPL